MKLNFKKMFAILLSIMLIVCVLPNSMVMAESTSSVDVATPEAAQAALDNATEGTVIKLAPGVDYGTLYLRPVAGTASTKEVDWIGNNYRYETYSLFENITIIGAEGATVDAIEIEGGTYYNTEHSQFDKYPIMLSLIELKNVVIDGVTFTGKGGYDPQGYGNAINLSGNNIKVNGLTLKNCVLNDSNNNARLIYKTESTTTVHTYTYGGETFTFSPSLKDITVTGCTFNGGYMGLELRETENLTITNNVFEVANRNILLPVNSGCTYSGTITITGNVSNNAKERFVRMAGAGDANVVVTGNTITNYLGKDADYIKVTDSTNTPVIENNTFSAVAKVATVNGVEFTSFIEALQYAVDNNATEVKALCDVREKMTYDFDLVISADLTITADAPVKLEFYNEGTSLDFAVGSTNNNTLTIAENVSFDLVDRVIWIGYYGNNVDVVVEGYLGGYQIWHGADTTVTETGFLDSHGEAFIMRRDATLTVDGGKVNANYFQIYSGHINATDADIDAGLVWINNNHSYGSEGTVSLTLDNTTFDSKGEIKVYAGADKTVDITLDNGASINAKGTVTLDESTVVELDTTSSFTQNDVPVVEAPNAYEIDSLEDLIKFRDSVNAGETKYNKADFDVILTADIDLSSVENWEPIGTFDYSFDGNFNGQGHKIMNLKMSDNTAANGEAYLGFFGVTANNTIENLVIENVTIESKGQIVAAAIAYPYYTEVNNITVCGDIAIKGGNYTAGVLAYTRLCQKASNLTVNGNAGSYITGERVVGGVIADIQMNKGLKADYSNFSAANVTITGTTCVGGISGIIASQAIDGVKVENVTLVCGDNRVGMVSGSFGGPSTITNVTTSNVTGATAIIGGAYEGAKEVQVKIGEKYYLTLNDALAAAKEGDVIKLCTDIYEPATMLVLPVGVSLDLQSHKLTVAYLVGFKGSHILGDTYKNDGSAYGQLVVAKDRVILSSEAYEDEVEAGVFRYVLPVWDSNDNCFVFGRYIVNETGGNRGFVIDEANNELRLQFKHKGSGTLTNTFFANGTSDNAVTFLVRISWISEHGDEIVQDYKYSDDMVILGVGDYDFGITFQGYQECTNITVTAMLVSSTGVTVAGTTHTVNALN